MTAVATIPPADTPRISREPINILNSPGIDPTGATDMAAKIQAAIDSTSTAAINGGYDWLELDFPRSGIFRIDTNLYLKPRVRLRLRGSRIRVGANLPTSGIFRAQETLTAAVAQGTGTVTSGSYEVTALTQVSKWREEDRVTGTGIPADTKVRTVDLANNKIVLDTAATATNTGVTLTRGATYYRTHVNEGLIGGILDPNGYVVHAIVRALWTENFLIDGTEAIHNRKSDGSDANWAWQLGGIHGLAVGPKVTGGRNLFEDGFHIMHGQHWRVIDANIEAGDDALVLGGAVSESTLATYPDPIRDVRISGNVTSYRAVAFKAYIESGDTAKGHEISDVQVDVTGRSGILRNGGITIDDFNAQTSTRDRIKNVRVNANLEVGGPAHDGTNPYGMLVEYATDVEVNLHQRVSQKASPATPFTLWRAKYVDDLVLGPGCRATVDQGSYTATDFQNCRWLESHSRQPGLHRERFVSEVFDDFQGLSLNTNLWSVKKGSNGSCDVLIDPNQTHGNLKLQTGNDASGDVAHNGAQIDTNLGFQRSNGSVTMGARLSGRLRPGGASLVQAMFMGFTDQNTAVEFPARIGVGDALTVVATDAVGFLFDPGADTKNWWAVGIATNTGVKANLGIAPALNANDTFALRVDGNGLAEFYSKGQKVASLSSAVGNGIALTPVVVTFATAANVRPVNLDFIRAEMWRQP